MSAELREKLQSLEEDYRELPPAFGQAELQEINQLRDQLGMPRVDANLHELTEAVDAEPEEPAPVANVTQEDVEFRELLQAYHQKSKELEVHRAYAKQVAKATSGSGQTPVRPLATMGTNGGPLLCDHCGKPIVLEGGEYHGITADVAWLQNPVKDWLSYILGGLVVETQTNGTLRIYHGYPERDGDCCSLASREDEQARAKHQASHPSPNWRKLLEFIEREFPELHYDKQTKLLNDVLETMFDYDPGIGRNRPSDNS